MDREGVERQVLSVMPELIPEFENLFQLRGRWFWSYITQVDTRVAAHPRTTRGIAQSPEFYEEKLFFDTLVYDHRVLCYLLGIFSIDQFLVGSDYPFLIRETPPGKILGTMGELTKNQRSALRRENALRFWGRRDPERK
jgi:aminocarboxymuconate-semialdehyde decarboxylase